MPDQSEVEFRAVPAQRVATITRRAAAFGSEHIGPVVGPIFPEVEALLGAVGVGVGPAVAVYAADGSEVLVTAGFEVPDDAPAVAGLDVHVLPELAQAAVATHRGSMATIDRSWAVVMDAARARGLVLAPASREIYLTPGDRPQEEWVTELVQPVTEAP